jgi:pilus assembly protein CpaF
VTDAKSLVADLPQATPADGPDVVDDAKAPTPASVGPHSGMFKPARDPAGSNVELPIPPTTSAESYGPTFLQNTPDSAPAGPRTRLVKGNAERSRYMQGVKSKIHQDLIERLDMATLKRMQPDLVRREVRQLVRGMASQEKGLFTAGEQELLVEEVLDETFGFGPLEPILKDPHVSDILVNRSDQIYVERKGRLTVSDVKFRDEQHLRQIIDRICAGVGRRVDETSPMVDARLPDGSRVNAIIPPLALDGSSMSIRRFGTKPLQLEDLLRCQAFPSVVMDFLSAAVQARCNIIISGGTGSGKTTLLNCLSQYVPSGERVVTVEDAAELQLQQPHVVRLETRPANIEGKGEVTARDLVRNSLRMRPDRIIIGETRGAEAIDMLQAMNTGHDGSMTTIHANTPRDAISRLEVLVAMAGYDIPPRGLRQQISSAVNIIVQSSRLAGGRRKVTYVTEVHGMEGETIQMQNLFTFAQNGVDVDGNATGSFLCHGIRPAVTDRIEHRGIRLPADMFVSRRLD